MAKIFNDLTETIGHTPLVRIRRLVPQDSLQLLAKCEFFNPLSSVKDRIGLAMIDTAEKDGRIRPGATVIEPTSGNTGIALAFVCAVRGYRCLLFMPESMSLERRALLRALGAELYLTPAEQGMRGAIEKAKEMAAEVPDSFIPMQFENPANPRIHQETTAAEIWQDTDGALDFFVAGVGTGGTITGIGRFLKAKKPDIRIIAVEPKGSPVLSGGQAGSHKIMGIGAGFVPDILDREIIDRVVCVDDQAAMQMARRAARLEGLMCGISSGAVLAAAAQLASEADFIGKTGVVLLASSGERYLSTELYSNYLY
ncbi:cysteine synthase A [candidate division KSB1 bacterium]|nr:cysteine synthase A [candidate division KSB1 bacterium]